MASRKGADKRKISAEELRQQLERDVERFLSTGGRINRVKEGVSGEAGWKRPKGDIRPNTRVQVMSPIAYGGL